MAAVADLVPRLNTPVPTLETKRPAILAAYLVNVGIEHYDGSLWPHQPMRQMSGNDLGPAFERVLHTLDLETFDDLGDDLGHRYLTRILGHGGIPKFSTRDFLRLVIDTLRRNPGARADDLVTLWRTQKTAFFGIDEPVRRFLLYGGPVALDFLGPHDRPGRTASLGSRRESCRRLRAAEPHRCRLRDVGFRVSRNRGRAGAVRLPRPTVRFDPWSGSGPVAELPAIGTRFPQRLPRRGRAVSARLVAASLLDLQQVPLAPAPTWGDRVRQRRRAQDIRLRGSADSAVVCFDPITGSYVPDTQPIALTDVWMLLPPDATLVRDGAVADQAATVLAELPAPTGAWHGFVARHVSLDGVRSLVVRTGGAGVVPAEAWLRVIRPGSADADRRGGRRCRRRGWRAGLRHAARIASSVHPRVWRRPLDAPPRRRRPRPDDHGGRPHASRRHREPPFGRHDWAGDRRPHAPAVPSGPTSGSGSAWCPGFEC